MKPQQKCDKQQGVQADRYQTCESEPRPSSVMPAEAGIQAANRRATGFPLAQE